MNALAGTNDLLFPWEAPRRRQLAILGFLAASAAGHALCFYLFQIVYPPTVALLPPPARVSLISGDSEESRTLLRWIAAEDPALASTTQRPPEAKAFTLPQVHHVPSYITLQPVLKELPAFRPDLRSPSSQPPGPVPRMRAPIQSPPLAVPTVRYCFLQNSSGDSALDEQARHYLALCRFAGSHNANSGEQDHLNWAAATVEWGNDIVIPPPVPAGNVVP